MSQSRVLVVDDDPMVVDVLGRYLVRDGFAVSTAHDGASALDQARRLPPELVILDVLLPVIDGLAVCRALRAKSRMSILLLSARHDEATKIRGFSLGADDYVVKPFSPREVLARVQALLRRASAVARATAGAELCFDGLRINVDYHRVERDGRAIELTAREFDLLLYLARQPRRVFTNDQLLDAVWGYDFAVEPGTVAVHMHRLRKKLERDPSHLCYLKTVYGVGYKFDPDAA